MKKLSPAIFLLIILLSCSESTSKRYLYFKNINKTYNFYLEGVKRKKIFKERPADIILKFSNNEKINKDYLKMFTSIEEDKFIYIEAIKNDKKIFYGIIELLDEDKYKIEFQEYINYSSATRDYLYKSNHKYTDSLHTIPLKTQSWLELTNEKGITKIVWNGKKYVL